MGKEVLLIFDKVKKSFGKKVVLNEVSFSVQRSDIFGFVGKSGGGKSTLIRILLGISKLTSGYIYFANKKISKDLMSLRKKVGFVSQGNSLFLELTLRENCKYFANLYGVKKDDFEERFNELVVILKFKGVEKFKLSTFSGGMLKRANILASLIHKPEILVLDEPTAGLDAMLREGLWKYIRNLNKEEGLTIFLVSHLLDEIEENCNRIGILKNGRIVALSEMKEYKKVYGKRSFKEIFQEIMKDENI
jgi:ABC-2 type transport system ATP-binding protein